jgi:hypothetical protein
LATTLSITVPTSASVGWAEAGAGLERRRLLQLDVELLLELADRGEIFVQALTRSAAPTSLQQGVALVLDRPTARSGAP